MKLKELLNVIDFDETLETKIVVRCDYERKDIDRTIFSKDWLNAKVEYFDVVLADERENAIMSIWVELPENAKKCEYIPFNHILFKHEAKWYLTPRENVKVQYFGSDKIYHRISKVENGKVYAEDGEIVDMESITKIERLEERDCYWREYRIVWDY